MTKPDLAEAVRLAKEYADAEQSDTFAAYNDAIKLAEALLASERERERMARVVEAARAVLHAWRSVPGAHSYQRNTRHELAAAIDALDALRDEGKE